MTHSAARTLLLLLLVGLGFGLVQTPVPAPSASGAMTWASPTQPQAERVVFLAKDLSPEQLVILSANLSAGRHPGVLLLDSPKTAPFLPLFLNAYQPTRIVPIGAFSEKTEDLKQRLGATVEATIPWEKSVPLELWRGLFPRAERVVVCPAEPYPLLLQAACLAGALRAPLYVVHGDVQETPHEFKELLRLLKEWNTQTIYAVGPASQFCRQISSLRIVPLPDEEAVTALYLRHQLKKGPIQTLVAANPADIHRPKGGMSPLAPWIALRKRAILLLTNQAGDNVGALVESALKKHDLREADHLILAADLEAIPMERRPNPLPGGKDAYIETEPLTPMGSEPFTFATGRLFHEDPGIIALLLARERVLKAKRRDRPRKALVVSNPGGGLPLLETLSRNTARELGNRGYATTALFGSDVNKDDLRRLLPEQDIFLWEGHHETLVKKYALPTWTEPLQPALIFLQSCLALQDAKAQPLMERGAIGVVGTSSRNYSASGGAFALSYFDALLYGDQSLGGSLRHAKNYLLAYSLLKEKRLGRDARMTGANLRSAWAFTLWGDPTLKLPLPDRPADALPPVRHKVRGDTIRVLLPGASHEKAVSERYQAQMPPNGRLAGLVRKDRKDADEEQQNLVPFLFFEVALPDAPPDKTPTLRSRLPSDRWVFCWDGRRRCGYLLMMPRAKDREEIRFHVEWQ